MKKKIGAEAAERPKNSCKTKEEHPGATDSPVDGAEGQVITEADTALATSDTQVKVSLCEARILQISPYFKKIILWKKIVCRQGLMHHRQRKEKENDDPLIRSVLVTNLINFFVYFFLLLMEFMFCMVDEITNIY